jgi:hypothetical protein
MDIRSYKISSFTKPQGHRHFFRENGNNEIFLNVYASKTTKLSSTIAGHVRSVSYVVSIISSSGAAAIIVRKLETCSPRRAGQGVSDPARAWNSSRDKIDRGDR